MRTSRGMALLGLVAFACGGAVLGFTSTDNLVAAAGAFGCMALGVVTWAAALDRYQQLRSAERRPLVSPRTAGALWMVLATFLALTAVAGTVGLIVSGSDSSWRLRKALVGLALFAGYAFVRGWRLRYASRRRSAVSSTRSDGDGKGAWTFRRRSSTRQPIVPPEIPDGPTEMWARPAAYRPNQS